jgi:hypothetical protein
VEASYLPEAISQLRGLKKLAEKAMAQVSDEGFFAVLDPESNSIALIVKHIAGNMRSRWTDFLTSDGEKPDRHRDDEFLAHENDTRQSLERQWEEAWKILFEALEPLSPDDLGRQVTIRGEAHSVLKAINRQMIHYGYHIGQLVFLAKHLAGSQWQSLSIPRGKSEDYKVVSRNR